MTEHRSTAGSRNPFEEFNEATESYGRAHGFEEDPGAFRHDARKRIRVMDGPAMVAEQLVRTLKTPLGDDPIRPDYGLDTQKLLGTSRLAAKEAIIEAIGPDADPRVAQLDPTDIEISEATGNREDTTITVTAHLADGTLVNFAMALRALTQQRRLTSSRENARIDRRQRQRATGYSSRDS